MDFEELRRRGIDSLEIRRAEKRWREHLNEFKPPDRQPDEVDATEFQKENIMRLANGEISEDDLAQLGLWQASAWIDFLKGHREYEMELTELLYHNDITVMVELWVKEIKRLAVDMSEMEFWCDKILITVVILFILGAILTGIFF